MKVGIDTFGLAHGESGLGSYLLYLMENLPYNQDIEYELFGHENDRYTYKAKFDIKYKAVNIKDSYFSEKFWHKLRLPSFVKKQKYDCVMYFGATRMLPIKFNVKSIAIVNEILSIDNKNENFADEISDDLSLEARKKHFNSKKILKSLKKIHKIIVPTEFLKRSLIALGIKESKITVIRHGIDHDIFYLQNLSQSEFVDIKPFAIKKPYIIYSTRLTQANKNHLQLIESFNQFKQKTNLPHRLVLSGSHDEYAKVVIQKVLESPYSSDIFVTGFFPHKQMGNLYSNAELCVFPSSIEGVGIPVIETMACGIPVACAEAGALSEVAKDCALFFDPNDINQMSDCIEKLVTDKELSTNLSQKGLECAKSFTWENTCRKFVDLLLSM